MEGGCCRSDPVVWPGDQSVGAMANRARPRRGGGASAGMKSLLAMREGDGSDRSDVRSAAAQPKQRTAAGERSGGQEGAKLSPQTDGRRVKGASRTGHSTLETGGEGGDR